MSTQRWKAQVPVAFLARNQSAVLLTESVTANGVFVRTDAPPPPMTLLRVQFLLPPDSARLVIHGMVANTVRPQSPHSVAGVEVVFFAKSADGNARWDRFIKFLRETHPEAIDRPVMLARDVAESVERYAFVNDFSAIDVLPGGMFLATEQRFAVGSDVRVTLIDSATTERRAIDCVVRRRMTGSEKGIGVEYRNMTSDAWVDLTTFLRAFEGERRLRAEVHVVRAPYAPMTMQTLPGPWSNDVDPAPESVSSVAREDSWSLPPDSGWSEESKSA
jgi:hypothetical protein